MGYMHINNLYREIDIMFFKECFELEKIHGTSANVSWKYEEKKVKLHSGGASHENFVKLFNEAELKQKFEELFEFDVTLYGEAYGGKILKMSETYGKELKFIVFDVKIGDRWLDVINAHDVATKMGLEFVSYSKVSTDIKTLDYHRDLPSVQAKRNGMGDNKPREGIVLRPLIEVTKNNGRRIIVKHKGEAFSETATKREVSPEKLKVLEDAKEIAIEWVTSQRLCHVLDHIGNPTEIEKTNEVIKEMISDVYREAQGEIVQNKQVATAIGRLAAQLYKQRISKV